MNDHERDSMTNPIKVEPFLRWAGGKRKLTPIIHAMLPKNFSLGKNRFFEPFAGSAAVALSLAAEIPNTSVVRGSSIFLSDLNEEIINAFLVLQRQPGDLIEKLRPLQDRNNERDFYKIRESTPSEPIARAARFIYLNRTCFNGLYRENSDGKFNVPYGHLVNPVICDEPLLRAVSQWLARVAISKRSFHSAVEMSRAGDVVYFDPPYLPLSSTSSFSQYDASGFSEVSHGALAGAIRLLRKRRVRVILSNSDCAATRDIYSSCGLTMRTVRVRRNISAKGSSRVKVRELLAFSYPLRECRDPEVVADLTRPS
jgi:DNA adenine methylase